MACCRISRCRRPTQRRPSKATIIKTLCRSSVGFVPATPAGWKALYRILCRYFRFHFVQNLMQDVEDRVHEAFLLVMRAIVRGELRDPERLMGFVRAVVRRQVALSIAQIVQTRRRPPIQGRPSGSRTLVSADRNVSRIRNMNLLSGALCSNYPTENEIC
jgi:hypothetical protein